MSRNDSHKLFGNFLRNLEHKPRGRCVNISGKKVQILNKPYKPMDIALLVKVLAPCMPFLMTVGNKVVGGVSQKIGEDVWNKAKAIWEKLYPKVEAKEAALEAATDVAKNPEDQDLQIALRVQLKKILESDSALAAEIAKILEEKSTTGVGSTNITQSVTGSDNQAIGQMQDNAKAIGQVHGNVNM